MWNKVHLNNKVVINTNSCLTKQEEQMLRRLTLNCTMHIYVSANPLTLSKGQRSLKQYTLVVLMGVYDHTKFEVTRYHRLRKRANNQVSTKFPMTSITSPWIKNSPIKLVCMSYFHFRLYPYQVSSSSSQSFLRYTNRHGLPFATPVTLSKGQRSPKMTHTCSTHGRL